MGEREPTSSVNDTLPENQEGEGIESMAAVVQCPGCVKFNETKGSSEFYRDTQIAVRCYRPERQQHGATYGLVLEGIVECTLDGHRRPIKLIDDLVDQTAPQLPVNESRRLHGNVPVALKDDVREAERCHFSQAYRASMVMCRRALQLCLIDKGINDGPLSRMLGDAQTNKILGNRAYLAALGIKDYGDGGAHRQETFTPEQVATVVHGIVEVLNEIYPRD